MHARTRAGNGRSQKPRLLDARTWWTVDDHFLQDVPAVLRYVLDTSGARQVHWVGHSMGGMLAVGLHSQQHPLAGALRSITLLASGCFGAGSWHHALRPLISVLTRCGFPAGVVAATIGALSGTAAALRPLEALFYWPCNTPPAAARKLMSDGFHFIPVGVIRQFMGSLNSRHGLSAADGSFLYANPHTLALARVPIMALSGDWDLFCPASGAQRTLAMFGGDAKRFVCFGPAHGTGRRHYGHFDIVCGKDAGSEVYPHVYAWLAEHDGVLSGQRPRGGSAAAPQ
jgi:pimeloyl-ACP methyl ester carboxylesterase